MNTNWQVVLGNIHSTFRVLRHLVFSLGKSSAPPCVPRAVKVMLLLLSLQFINACDTSNRNSAPIFSQEPTLLQYDSLVPLSTAIAFESDQPVFATYKISDGQSSWQAHTLSDPNQKPTHLSKSHRDFLLKFKPDTKHRIYVRITNAAGQTKEYAKPLILQTPPLPQDFPQIDISESISDGATDKTPLFKQDEIVLISMINKQSEPNFEVQNQGIKGWLIAVDPHSAEIVWYMPTDTRWHSLEQLQSGNLRLLTPLGSTLEIDMLGSELAGWLAQGDTEFSNNRTRQSLLLDSNQAAITSPATVPKIPLRLDSGLITDSKLVSRLIPPAFDDSDYRKLLLASKSNQKASDIPKDEALAVKQSSVQIPDDIIVIEGDWQIVLESPEELTEQTLTIDKQQGSIGLGYLDNYPVMAVIKGNRIQFKVRSTGADRRVTWHYQGLLDDNGLEAHGELRLLDEQNDILGLATPWQAYRQ